jgi:hypothetical protein
LTRLLQRGPSAPGSAAAVPQPPARPAGGLGAEVRELAIIAALPALYWLAAPFLAVRPVYHPAATVGGPLLVMAVLIWVQGVWDLRPRPGPDGRRVFPISDRSLIHMLLARVWQDRAYWLRGAFLLALALTFLDVYAAYKQAIPRFADYSWDPLLSELDRRVHGGVHPWQLLRGMLDVPAVMFLLDRTYFLWYATSLTFLTLIAWSRDRQRRVRFMLTFYATWIFGGTVLAMVFASGGPVYFAQFAPDTFNPYEPLVRTLHETDGLTAIRGHLALWQGFSEGGHPRASGISAMPSIHVAMAILCVLAARTFNRTFGAVMMAYAALIVVGSVMLAWHYAIDAYVSIPMVLALWWLAGRVAKSSCAR